jgi:DNA replication protein DnaC
MPPGPHIGGGRVIDQCAGDRPSDAPVVGMRLVPQDEAQSRQILQSSAKQAARNNSRAKPTKPRFALPEGVPDPALDQEALRREQLAEESRRAGLVQSLISAAGIPRRYEHATLKNEAMLLRAVPLEHRQRYLVAAKALREDLERPALIALLGEAGPGKTWLACAAVLDACREGRRAEYVETADFFDAVKETYSGVGRESSVIRSFVEPSLLVLDEIEVCAATTWEDQKLNRLINKRYADRKTTILVSNLDAGAFEKRVGLRIADRFKDDGDVIRCNWGSIRGMVEKS